MLDAKAKRRQAAFVRRGLKRMAKTLRLMAAEETLKGDDAHADMLIEMAEGFETPQRGRPIRYEPVFDSTDKASPVRLR